MVDLDESHLQDLLKAGLIKAEETGGWLGGCLSAKMSRTVRPSMIASTERVPLLLVLKYTYYEYIGTCT